MPTTSIDRDELVARQRETLLARRKEAEERYQLLVEEERAWTEAQEGVETQFDEESGEGSGHAAERERVQRLLVNARNALSGLDDALARLEAGKYGTCVRCGAEIPTERLEVLPDATECVACKSASPLRRR